MHAKTKRMNKSNLLNTLLLFVLLGAAGCSKDTSDLPWDYPVKPGSDAWNEFTSNEEQVAACQIPDRVLTSLSTEELTAICLNYPLLYDVFAFDNLNIGLDKLFSDFNGIRELNARTGATEELLKQYDVKIESMIFLDVTNPDDQIGLYVMSISALETLLTRTGMQGNEDTETLIKILQHLLTGYESKLNHADYFQGLGLGTNYYSRANIIIKIDPSSIELLPGKDQNAALSSTRADAETVKVLDELSYQLTAPYNNR